MHRPIIVSMTALALLAGPAADATVTPTPTSPSGATTTPPIGDAIATAWLRMPESGHGCGDAGARRCR